MICCDSPWWLHNPIHIQTVLCPTTSPISLMSWGHKYCTRTSESWIIPITSFFSSFCIITGNKSSQHTCFDIKILPKLTRSIQDKSTAHEINCSVAYDLCHHNHFSWFPMVFVCAFNMGADNGTVVSVTGERSLKNNSCDKSQWRLCDTRYVCTCT